MVKVVWDRIQNVHAKNLCDSLCVPPADVLLWLQQKLKIAEHHWDELGMPETLWCCKVREFGPLIVSIDAQGRNLFEENKVIFNQKKEEAKQDIYPEVKFIK